METWQKAIIAVLGIGLILALGNVVLPAYFWSGPVMESEKWADIRQFEDKIEGFHSSLVSTAEGDTSSGQEVLNVEDGYVRFNNSGNYIQIAFPFEENYYSDSWRLLRGTGRQGLSFGIGEYAIQGQRQSVVAARSLKRLTVYRIEFRNLRVQTSSGPEMKYVDLSGDFEEVTGDVTIGFKNRGKSQDNFSTSVDTLNRTVTEVGLNVE